MNWTIKEGAAGTVGTQPDTGILVDFGEVGEKKLMQTYLVYGGQKTPIAFGVSCGCTAPKYDHKTNELLVRVYASAKPNTPEKFTATKFITVTYDDKTKERLGFRFTLP